MKLYKQIIFILVVFFKTETLFSENNLFNVNNIQIKKKNEITNNILADQAIKEGFDQLIEKILLINDSKKLSDLSLPSIKQLVTYYRIINTSNRDDKEEYVNFNVSFNKEKIHDLFYKRGISYSEIADKELYILPLLIKNNEIFIFNKNFFYKNWNKVYKNNLIEFILPLENIEIIQNINSLKNDLINLNIDNLFKEYMNKNLAFILIEDNVSVEKKIYIKTKIQGKKISKSLNLEPNTTNDNFYENIITEIKKELIDLVKSKNLIDVRVPSFLNVRLNINKDNNLVKLNSKINKIDIIENIYVQEFNKDYMNLRIKYLGKLEKIISLFKVENVELKLINDQWIIETL